MRKISLHSSLWLTVGDDNFGGMGRVTLLERIAETGSITKAARSMKMSYKAAWDAVDMMNNLAGEPLVERQVGGKGGGGTALTERGRRLVENFEHLKREHQRFIDHLNEQVGAIADDVILVKRLSLKTSARNQFPGRVKEIREGAVNDEVLVECPRGMTISATITRESAAELELKPGVEVFALTKAGQVKLEAPVASGATGVNAFAGSVESLSGGEGQSEAAILTEGGAKIFAIVDDATRKKLALEEGAKVVAKFVSTNVILGVPV